MEKLEHETKRTRTIALDTPVPGEQANHKSAHTLLHGLSIDAEFCPADAASPFDTVEWEKRTAQIKGEGGEVFFEQKDCEIPATWSQLATNVVVSKYFYGEVNTPEREFSVKQLIHRVSRTITDWGLADGYFASPEDAERFAGRPFLETLAAIAHDHLSASRA